MATELPKERSDEATVTSETKPVVAEKPPAPFNSPNPPLPNFTPPPRGMERWRQPQIAPLENASNGTSSNSNRGTSPGPKFSSTRGRITCSVITTSASSFLSA